MSRSDFARRFAEATGIDKATLDRITSRGLLANKLTPEDIKLGFSAWRNNPTPKEPPTRFSNEVGYGIPPD